MEKTYNLRKVKTPQPAGGSNASQKKWERKKKLWKERSINEGRKKEKWYENLSGVLLCPVIEGGKVQKQVHDCKKMLIVNRKIYL